MKKAKGFSSRAKKVSWWFDGYYLSSDERGYVKRRIAKMERQFSKSMIREELSIL